MGSEDCCLIVLSAGVGLPGVLWRDAGREDAGADLARSVAAEA